MSSTSIPPDVIDRVDAFCGALYSSTTAPAQRALADAELSRIFSVPSDASTGGGPTNAQVRAGRVECMPTLRSILSSSNSVFTALFCLGAVTFCLDNSWAQLSAEARWDIRCFLLEWVSTRGPGSVPAARAATSALARVTVLAWRTDSRHHATARHALQFLAPRARGHWAVGLDLWAQLICDMQRPHAVLNERPTVRLLLFRDIALRPLFTRLVSQLFELLGEARAALLGILAGGAQVDAALVSLLSIADLGASVAGVAESVLTYAFDCGISSGGGASGGDGDDLDDENGGVNDGLGGGVDPAAESDTTTLPSTWTALKHSGSKLIFFAWIRIMAAAHGALYEAGGGAAPALSAARGRILSSGLVALRCVSSFAGSRCTLWGAVETARLRRAMLRLGSFLCALCLGAPGKAEIARAGWVHETARFLFRIKLCAVLSTLSASTAWAPFCDFAAQFTYALIAPPAMLLPGPRFGEELDCINNTIYYMLSFWVMVMLPCGSTPLDDPASSQLRSAIAPITDVLIARYGGDAVESKEDAGGLCASGGFGGDTVEDDTLELAAEVVRFNTPHAAAAISAKLESVARELLCSSTPAAAAPLQLQLAWLLRFAAALSSSALASAGDDDEMLLLGSVPPATPALSSAPQAVGVRTAAYIAEFCASVANGGYLVAPPPSPVSTFAPRATRGSVGSFGAAAFVHASFSPPTGATSLGPAAVGASAPTTTDGNQSNQFRVVDVRRRTVPSNASSPGRMGAAQLRGDMGSSSGGVGMGDGDVETGDGGGPRADWAHTLDALSDDATDGLGMGVRARAGRLSLVSWLDGPHGRFAPSSSSNSPPTPFTGGGGGGVGALEADVDDDVAHATLFDFADEDAVSAANGVNDEGLFIEELLHEDAGASSTDLGLHFVAQPMRNADFSRLLWLPRALTYAASATEVHGLWTIPESEEAAGGAFSKGSSGAGVGVGGDAMADGGDGGSGTSRMGQLASLGWGLPPPPLQQVQLQPQPMVRFISSQESMGDGGMSGSPPRLSQAAPQGFVSRAIPAVASSGTIATTSTTGAVWPPPIRTAPVWTRDADRAATLPRAATSNDDSSCAERLIAPLVATAFRVLLRLRARSENEAGAGAVSSPGVGRVAGSVFGFRPPPSVLPTTVAARQHPPTLSEIDDVGFQLLGSLSSLTISGMGGGRSSVSAAAATAAAAARRRSPVADMSGRSSPCLTADRSGRSSPLGDLGEAPPTYPTWAWTPERAALELSFLAFIGHFQCWYGRYRAAAAAVARVENLVARAAEAEALPRFASVRAAADDGPPPLVRLGSTQFEAITTGQLMPWAVALSVVEATGELPAGTTPRDPYAAADAARDDAEVNRLWRSMPLDELRERARAERSANLLCAVCERLGARAPHELLDCALAKVLGLVRFAGAPDGVLRASLTMLHELVSGSVVLVSGHGTARPGAALGLEVNGRVLGSSSSGGVGGDADTGAFSQGSGLVEIGADLLRTTCVQVLLRRAASVDDLFPALAPPRLGRLVTLVHATLTRLVFLHTRTVTTRERALLEGAPDAAASSAALEADGSLAFDGGGGDWFTAFATPLGARVAAVRTEIGLPPTPPPRTPYVARTANSDADVGGRADGLAAGAAGDALAAWARGARGLFAGATTPQEWLLVNDWFVTGTGGCAVLSAGATVAARAALGGGGAGDSKWGGLLTRATPLLRLIAEWANSRGGRIAPPSNSAAPLVILREGGRLFCTIVSAMRALVASVGGEGGAAALKLARLACGAGARLLGLLPICGAGAAAAAYGDSTPHDVWRALAAVTSHIPYDAAGAITKLSREAAGALSALAFAALPPSDALEGIAINAPSCGSLGGALGLGSPPSPRAAASLVINLSSAELGALAALASRAFLSGGGKKDRARCSLGVRATLQSLAFLEAVASLEADARAAMAAVLAAADRADATNDAIQAVFESRGAKLNAVFSCARISPALAVSIVKKADASALVGVPDDIFSVDFFASLLVAAARDGNEYVYALARVLLPAARARPAAWSAAIDGLTAAAGNAAAIVKDGMGDLGAALDMGIYDADPTQGDKFGEDAKDAFARNLAAWARDVGEFIV